MTSETTKWKRRFKRYYFRNKNKESATAQNKVEYGQGKINPQFEPTPQLTEPKQP